MTIDIEQLKAEIRNLANKQKALEATVAVYEGLAAPAKGKSGAPRKTRVWTEEQKKAASDRIKANKAAGKLIGRQKAPKTDATAA